MYGSKFVQSHSTDSNVQNFKISFNGGITFGKGSGVMQNETAGNCASSSLILSILVTTSYSKYPVNVS